MAFISQVTTGKIFSNWTVTLCQALFCPTHHTGGWCPLYPQGDTCTSPKPHPTTFFLRALSPPPQCDSCPFRADAETEDKRLTCGDPSRRIKGWELEKREAFSNTLQKRGKRGWITRTQDYNTENFPEAIPEPFRCYNQS